MFQPWLAEVFAANPPFGINWSEFSEVGRGMETPFNKQPVCLMSLTDQCFLKNCFAANTDKF